MSRPVRKKPENPMAGLRLHGNTYQLNIRRNGKREFISLQTSDPAEAIRRKRELLLAPALAPKGALATEIQRYLDYKVRMNIFSRQSARVAGAALREFCEGVSGASAASVRREQVKAHYAKLQKRVKEATAQIHMRAIAAFFTWCSDPDVRIRRKELENPARIKFAKIDQPARQRFCTRDQRNELIDNAPTDDLRFILLMGFHAGLRKNEIIEARVDWFDLNESGGPEGIGTIHVQNTPTFRIKDREARFIPMSQRVRAFLREYLKGKAPDQWALRPNTVHGKGTYRYDFHAPYNLFLAEMKMRWVTAHVMRHTFASLLAQEGVSIFKVAKWLGDGVEVVQKHYAHLAPQDSDLERAMN